MREPWLHGCLSSASPSAAPFSLALGATHPPPPGRRVGHGLSVRAAFLGFEGAPGCSARRYPAGQRRGGPAAPSKLS